MKQISRRAVSLLLVLMLFLAGMGIFLTKFAVRGEDWATYPTNRALFNDGNLAKAGTITDIYGTVLAETNDGVRSFASDSDIRKSTFHAVGDLGGKVATSLHGAFRKQLTGYDILSGTYNMSGKGNDITLTLDASLCETALSALGSYSGTVGVYNYKTGEIICMVSTPTADPSKMPDGGSRGLYVNRLLSGIYAPGSIFKLVTATAAIENLNDYSVVEYSCSGGVMIDGEWVSCLGNHGMQNIRQALTNSCNAYFAQLAAHIGHSTMTKTAQKLGFNKAFEMDGIKCGISRYDVKNARNIELAWSGMGQYNDTVNPLHYLTFMGAIANGGIPKNPFLIGDIRSPNGLPVPFFRFTQGSRMMSAHAAEVLSDMMRNNVVENYGDGGFSGLELCAKTGTAETEDDSPHSWFVGFCRSEEKPYAFVVVAENAGAGIGVASHIAARVLKAAETVD